MIRRNESARKASGNQGRRELPVEESSGVSWCCERHCWVAIVFWSRYCFLSFVSFILRHLVIGTPRNCQTFY